MYYQSYTLNNGLRIIHLPSNSQVSYCGFAINAGSRDEIDGEFGMAHFVEHMLFKGTQKRKARHILNRMEVVGGELNAYTTKEETFIYSIFLEQHFGRAFELLSDLVFHSGFPEKEAKKEIEVIIDEINSYEDNPSELIYDEFENMLFEGHGLGHYILGDSKTLRKSSGKKGLEFVRNHYRPSNMIFFSMGKTDFKKIIRLAERFTGSISNNPIENNRISPKEISVKEISRHKKTSQTHMILGNQSYSIKDPKRAGLYLLNNILGGPGMNSRLNIALRELNGLVYQVDSSLTSYTDTGYFSIYFGTEKKNKDKCLQLVLKELKRLRENKFTASQLHAAKKQLIGQLGVGSDNHENVFLGMGKSFLHFNEYDTPEEVFAKIQSVTSESILEIANEVMSEDRLSILKYE